MPLDAPFPWFGGKSRVASEVWARFGDVGNYVEPFFGSGAVLLGRPPSDGMETVNDLDGYVANFWRSIKLSPEVVAEHADQPVNENDLHARHVWLLTRRDTLRAQLEGDPEWHDPKVAGFWVWGICCWIGGGFCSGAGPWRVNADGLLVKQEQDGDGVTRQLPHLGNDGRGVSRRRPQLGNDGRGVHRRLHRDGDSNRLLPWFRALSGRLRNVRVCSGDWSRVCGPSVTTGNGMTGVFLDPPYADTAGRDSDLYRVDSEQVAHQVREWAIENGNNPLLRIALCGYDGEHEMPASWSVHSWLAHGGYAHLAPSDSDAAGRENRHRERIWFSPACLQRRQLDLFAVATTASTSVAGG